MRARLGHSACFVCFVEGGVAVKLASAAWCSVSDAFGALEEGGGGHVIYTT